MATWVLTYQFEYAGNSGTADFDLRVDEALPQAAKDPLVGQDAPLVCRAVRDVCKDEYSLQRV